MEETAANMARRGAAVLARFLRIEKDTTRASIDVARYLAQQGLVEIHEFSDIDAELSLTDLGLDALERIGPC